MQNYRPKYGLNLCYSGIKIGKTRYLHSGGGSSGNLNYGITNSNNIVKGFIPAVIYDKIIDESKRYLDIIYNQDRIERAKKIYQIKIKEEITQEEFKALCQKNNIKCNNNYDYDNFKLKILLILLFHYQMKILVILLIIKTKK